MLPSLVLNMCWALSYSLFPLLIHTVPQNVGCSTRQLVDSNNTDIVKEKTRQGDCSISKRIKIGNSLAIQWLGPCILISKGLGSISGQGTKIPQAIWSSQKENRKRIKINDT